MATRWTRRPCRSCGASSTWSELRVGHFTTSGVCFVRKVCQHQTVRSFGLSRLSARSSITTYTSRIPTRKLKGSWHRRSPRCSTLARSMVCGGSTNTASLQSRWPRTLPTGGTTARRRRLCASRRASGLLYRCPLAAYRVSRWTQRGRLSEITARPPPTETGFGSCLAASHGVIYVAPVCVPTSSKGHSGRKHFYYRCWKRMKFGGDACPLPANYQAHRVESAVWGFVSSLLKNPEQLRADLDRMIELERQDLRGNPDGEAKAWLEKLSEVDRKRSGFQDMAAEGLITLDELKVKLAGLEELRETARWELDALSRRREKIAELERDKDALLEFYVGMVPEALDSLTPEEHHYVYKILRLRVALRPDAPPEVSGMFGGDLDVSNTETASVHRIPLTSDKPRAPQQPLPPPRTACCAPAFLTSPSSYYLLSTLRLKGC